MTGVQTCALPICIGAIGGALSHEKATESLPEYLSEKAKSVGINAAIGGAVPATVETAKGLGSLIRKGIGMSTGAGEEAVKQAYKSGKEGEKTFIENMRGQVPMENVLNDAKANLDNANITYGYTHVLAPFTGRIGRHLIDPGNLVGNGEATELASIQQLDPIYVYFNVKSLF